MPAVLADTVQGVVKNENGDTVAGVSVSLTGALVGAQTPVLTDVSGVYVATVPADTYTMVFTPPPAAGLVPERITGVIVSGATDLGDRILRFGVDVTGLVIDPLSNPVAGVDLRFADLATGQTIYTPNDDTDPAGNYAVFVPPGNYEVEFRPPVLVDLAPLEWPAVPIPSAVTLPTAVLPDGVVVIGTVLDELGAAVADVDLDFIDTATGNKIFTTRDDTNEFGIYRTVVVPGVYDMRYLPPAASGLVAKEIPGVVLSADVTLPDVVLASGMEFSGRVVNDQGAGLADVDLNVFDAISGEQLLTPGDDTDADGNYLLPLQPGTYDVRYTPPAGPPYLQQLIEGIVVTADVLRPDVVLELGFLVTGTTVDGNTQPVADVDLDFKDTSTNAFIFVVRDDSDTSGNFAVAVPGATYRVDFDPPAGTIYLPLSLPDVLVDQDRDLGDVVISQTHLLSGHVQDTAGTPLAGVRFEIREEATGDVVPLEGDLTDAAGYFGTRVPPDSYRVYLEPPAGSTAFPLLTDPVTVDVADVDLGVLVLVEGFAVEGVVVDTFGAAIAGVTVRLEEGPQVFEGLTDAAGRFAILVPAGSYTLQYDPQGLPFLPQTTGPLAIAADTLVPRAVLQPALTVSGRVVDDALTGIPAVDVDMLDDVTGVSVPLQGDLTGVDGFFAVKVADGVYRLRLQPDPDSGFFEIETTAFAVTADIDVGDQVLPRAVTIDGRVTDAEGAVARNVDVEFLPEPTNPHPDSLVVQTNGNGRFSAAVPQGDYRMRYDPPLDSPLFGLDTGPFSFLTDQTLVTVILESGLRVSGTVVDDLLMPVGGVDVDFLDGTTGQSIPLEGDLTDVTGRFDVLVRAGTYLVRLEPDPATRRLPLVTEPVIVDADIDVGQLVLLSGVLLGGDVVDDAAGAIAGVNIDVVDQTSGLDVVLVGDRTDEAGAFTTAVPTGDYFVEYRPPAGTAYVAQRIGPVAVPGDTQLPTVTLPTGTLVSGVVLDPGFAPLEDVETEWRPAGTCDLVFTVRDSTDPGGRFEVALLPGNYDVTLIPPPASGLVAERIPSVVVSGPETVLPTHTLSVVPPPIELCNQLDDDCDGATDEAYPDLGDACTSGLGTCETAGVLVCGADGTQSVCDAVPGAPSPDVCDGVDNDCDGVVDEGCASVESALVVERTAVFWSTVPDAVNYDVLRGDLGLLFTGGFTSSVLTCLAEDSTVTELADTEVPASGQGFWILVRANVATGPGIYGDPPRDAEISASGLDCSP